MHSPLSFYFLCDTLQVPTGNLADIMGEKIN
jgi:hypothetical protein